MKEKTHKTCFCILSDKFPESPCACVMIKIPDNIAELIGEEKLEEIAKEIDEKFIERLKRAIKEGLRLREELRQAELEIVRRRLERLGK